MFDPALNATLQRMQWVGFDWFFLAATALAYAPVLIGLLSILYWSWNKDKAFGLIQLCVYSNLIEHLLKETFQSLRPFQVDPQHVQVLDCFMRRQLDLAGSRWLAPDGVSYSFPSGHAQVAICLYGALAFHLRRRAVTIGAVILIALIAFSRLYLGVHFLGDVLGGVVIGSMLLAVYLVIVRQKERRVANLSYSCPERRTRIFTGEHFMVFLLFAAPIVLFLPRADMLSARRVAFLLGFMAGYFAERGWLRFSTSGPTKQQTQRVALGLITLGGAYLISNRLLSSAAKPGLSWAIFLNAVCYSAIGLMVSLGIPWLFTATALANRREKEKPQ